MPKNEPGAVITNIDEAVTRAMDLAKSETIETLCVHGDGPTAVAILRKLRKALEAGGLIFMSKPSVKCS